MVSIASVQKSVVDARQSVDKFVNRVYGQITNDSRYHEMLKTATVISTLVLVSLFAPSHMILAGAGLGYTFSACMQFNKRGSFETTGFHVAFNLFLTTLSPFLTLASYMTAFSVGYLLAKKCFPIEPKISPETNASISSASVQERSVGHGSTPYHESTSSNANSQQFSKRSLAKEQSQEGSNQYSSQQYRSAPYSSTSSSSSARPSTYVSQQQQSQQSSKERRTANEDSDHSDNEDYEKTVSGAYRQ